MGDEPIRRLKFGGRHELWDFKIYGRVALDSVGILLSQPIPLSILSHKGIEVGGWGFEGTFIVGVVCRAF